MEICVTLVTILTVCIAVFIVKWIANRRKRHELLKNCSIPGPDPDLLSGNLKELKTKRTPNEIITSWLQKYGNVFGYYLGEKPQIVIKDLDMLKQVFIKDSHVFYNRPQWFVDFPPVNISILSLKDKRWKEVRSLLTTIFSSGKIKLISHIVRKKVDITVSRVEMHAEKDEIFDIYELVQGLTLDVIADCAFAMKTQCQENPKDIFLLSVRDLFRYAHNKTIDYAIMFPFVSDLMTFICKFLTIGETTTLIVDSVKTAISTRRKNSNFRSMDILQLMLDCRENDESGSIRLTDEEIVANAYVFLLAGYETTATSLAFTFYFLIKYPEIQERLYKEIENADDSYNTVQNHQYLDQVFSESLRYYPPVTGFVTRLCSKNHQVGSIKIPKGATVIAPVWDIHHDPEFWPDPWKFDPERFAPENKKFFNSMAYMPFGIGTKHCIGSRLAKLAAKLAIFKLVKKFRLESCERTEDPLSLKCPTFITSPENGVYLRAIPRTDIT